jgi:GNAT superfamily N-acetyltransferase
MVHLRTGTRADIPLILELIRALAEYEKLAHACVATAEKLDQSLFGPRPYAEAIIAEWNGEPVGFALFFHNYSTFLAQPGIYLEDLFVKPEFRGKGIGKALLVKLAQIAEARDCGRLEWSVLDWNEPSIGFYKKLGARPLDDWTTFRLAGAELRKLSMSGLGRLPVAEVDLD